MKTDLLKLAEQVEQARISALSVKQPWAHRILREGKDIENRDWPTRLRGWCLLHTGKSTNEDSELIRELRLPLGAVVGAMRIEDCVQGSESPWFFGKYGFVIGDRIAIEPVPARGQLGFFRFDTDTNSKVAASLRAIAKESE